jgi:hypothetical protein
MSHPYGPWTLDSIISHLVIDVVRHRYKVLRYLSEDLRDALRVDSHSVG